MQGDMEQNITSHPDSPPSTDHHLLHPDDGVSTTTGVNEIHEADDDENAAAPPTPPHHQFINIEFNYNTPKSTPPYNRRRYRCPISAQVMTVYGYTTFGFRMMGSFCWFGVNAVRSFPNKKDAVRGSKTQASEVYGKLSDVIDPFNGRALILTVTSRVGCLLLLWLVVSAPLPALKTATFLGVIHWKWSLLATLLVFCYPYFHITASVHLIFEEHYSQSYFVSGLLESLTTLLYIIVIFLVWMLSFHAQEGGRLYTGVDYYTTRTLAVLLVGAFLWVLKRGLLLRWQQIAIYTKFKARIIMSALRLFFITLIFDHEADPILIDCFDPCGGWKSSGLDSPEPSLRPNVQQYAVSANVSMHVMDVMARYLTTLAKFTPREGADNWLSRIMEEYRHRIQIQAGDSKPRTVDEIIDCAKHQRRELLEKELQEEYPSKEINDIPLDKWVADAHKNCIRVGYSLIDAFAMVTVLDTILTCCLIVAVTLLWLLVTEIATTKVLVVIASPFLALTFMFGDTCKTFFQGFIFAFISHPFDIGDRCILDGIEVEVKRINIMTTTCLKIGTKEQMMYPNSMLATTLITNLGNKLDPADAIELVLPSSTNMSTILELKENVKKFLDLDKQREFFEKSHRVVVKEMKNDIKIFIYFEHTMDGKDVSHSQFLIKKESQRSELFIEIKQFLEKLGVQVATS